MRISYASTPLLPTLAMNALVTTTGILMGAILLCVGLLTFALIVHTVVVRRREPSSGAPLPATPVPNLVPLGTSSVAENGGLNMESLEEVTTPHAFLDGGFNYTIQRRRFGVPRPMPNLGGFSEVPLLFYDRDGSYLVLRRTLCLN